MFWSTVTRGRDAPGSDSHTEAWCSRLGLSHRGVVLQARTLTWRRGAPGSDSHTEAWCSRLGLSHGGVVLQARTLTRSTRFTLEPCAFLHTQINASQITTVMCLQDPSFSVWRDALSSPHTRTPVFPHSWSLCRVQHRHFSCRPLNAQCVCVPRRVVRAHP